MKNDKDIIMKGRFGNTKKLYIRGRLLDEIRITLIVLSKVLLK